jgi:hypothetical protein
MAVDPVDEGSPASLRVVGDDDDDGDGIALDGRPHEVAVRAELDADDEPSFWFPCCSPAPRHAIAVCIRLHGLAKTDISSRFPLPKIFDGYCVSRRPALQLMALHARV